MRAQLVLAAFLFSAAINPASADENISGQGSRLDAQSSMGQPMDYPDARTSSGAGAQPGQAPAGTPLQQSGQTQNWNNPPAFDPQQPIGQRQVNPGGQQFTPVPAQPQTAGGTIRDLIRQVKESIQVRHNGDNVRVKAPFVDVNVAGGQPDVQVHAPMVNIDHAGGQTGGVQRIRAPFVDVNVNGAQPDVKVRAPFVKVDHKD